jgi:hypothetical protein
MEKKPAMFDPDEMARRVEKLKAEQRMPSFEAFEQVMGLIRDKWRDAVCPQSGARKPKPN